MVHCVRHQGEGVALTTPPFKGDLGQEIYTRICSPCWEEWKAYQVKIINEYRLKTYDTDHQKILRQHMRDFLLLDGEGAGSPEELPGEKAGGGV